MCLCYRVLGRNRTVICAYVRMRLCVCLCVFVCLGVGWGGLVSVCVCARVCGEYAIYHGCDLFSLALGGAYHMKQQSISSEMKQP